MNLIASKIAPISTLLKGSLNNFTPNFNHVIVRTGTSRVIAKSVKPHRKWPGYRKKYKDGVQYYGFTYYPRSSAQVDPLWKPTELFMVQRLKCYKGNPYWEKEILKKYHLDGVKTDIAIVPNNEITNAELYKIKHLIQITPITFPDGYPTQEDISRCRLFENGELRMNNSYNYNPESLKAVDEMHRRPDGPTGREVAKYARQRWLFPFQSNVPI